MALPLPTLRLPTLRLPTLPLPARSPGARLLPGLTIALALSFAVPPPALAAGPAESGRWITETGNLEIEIAPCGDALCGTVVKVLGNRSMSMPGETVMPVNGESPLGKAILTGLRPGADGELDGQIYNRENGKTYGVRLVLQADQQLKVRPYVTPDQFGPTQLWRRPAPGQSR